MAEPSAPGQGSCQRRAGCDGAGEIARHVPGELDFHGILKSTARQLCARCTTSQEAFALLHLEQL